MKHKFQQRRLRKNEQLEFYIRQKWDNILLPNVQPWSPQFPNAYRQLVKEEKMVFSGKHGLNFSEQSC